MNKPLDELAEELGSRYALVIAAAKRAKQIKEGKPVFAEARSKRPVVIALEEIAERKVLLREPSEEEEDGVQVIDRVSIEPADVDDLLGEALAARVRAAGAEQEAGSEAAEGDNEVESEDQEAEEKSEDETEEE